MILEFVLASLLIEATPGPNMTYLALLSLARGRKAGFYAVAGVACGLFTIGNLVALGVDVVSSQVPHFYELVRYAGVAYLLWLAIDTYKTPIAENVSLGGAAYFRRGFITNMLNPKAAAFFVSVLPAFAEQSTSVFASTDIVLTMIYVAVATMVHSLIVLVAGAFDLRRLSKTTQNALQYGFAAALALVAVWFWWVTAR